MKNQVKTNDKLFLEMNKVTSNVLKKYCFIEENILQQIKQKAIDGILNAKRQDLAHYTGILTKLLDLQVRKGIVDETTTEYFINSYINLNYSIKNTSKQNCKTLDNFSRFFDRLGLLLSDKYCSIILNNEIIDGIIKSIVYSNLQTIETYGLDSITENKLSKILLKKFCEINNIQIKNNSKKSELSGSKYVSITKSIDIPRVSNLTYYEELELFKQYKNGDLTAKDKLINHNLRLVAPIAEKYAKTGVSYDDLYQTGCLGLIHAVDEYDYTYGNKFSSVATWYIIQYINSYVRKNTLPVRLPRYMSDLILQINKTKQKMHMELGHEPTIKEISEKINVNEEKIQKALNLSNRSISLDEKMSDEDERNLYNYISEDDKSLNNNIFEKQKKEIIDKVLNDICKDEKEKQIILFRYGFYGDRPLTLKEIGEKFGYSREWIRQLELKILKKIRKSKYKDILKTFLDYDTEKDSDNISFHK